MRGCGAGTGVQLCLWLTTKREGLGCVQHACWERVCNANARLSYSGRVLQVMLGDVMLLEEVRWQPINNTWQWVAVKLTISQLAHIVHCRRHYGDVVGIFLGR